jgi:hypothetical protein
MRAPAFAVAVLLALASPSDAQLIVNDPSVTLRNSLTATFKDLLVRLQQQQHSELRRMAHRLSMFTSLAKYGLADVPLWRIHDFESPNVLYARDYHAALNYGDRAGRGFLAVSQPVDDAAAAIATLPPTARRALSSRLATLDLTDAVVIAGTHDSGQLRLNGRREFAAIESLERDVTNDSLEQSTTAILDKISGASLIAARQRQARLQLMNGLVEQLLVDSKRARDTDAAAMDMQLVVWRDGAAANRAFVDGAADALSTWRQP